jgi:hypothetical protein
MGSYDPDFVRDAERALFVIETCQAAGISFSIRDGRFLEGEYPLLIESTFWRSCQEAILANKVTITKIVSARAELSS